MPDETTTATGFCVACGMEWDGKRLNYGSQQVPNLCDDCRCGVEYERERIERIIERFGHDWDARLMAAIREGRADA